MNIRISLAKDIIQAGCTNFKIIGKMGSHKIPKYELKMLAAKHLSIMPKYDRNDYARIGFQVEKAYWEYINQYPDAKEMEDKTFPLKEFCIHSGWPSGHCQVGSANRHLICGIFVTRQNFIGRFVLG